jgi:hypothetical protein
MAEIYSSRTPEHFATARKFVPAPIAALPSSHLDGLQNISLGESALGQGAGAGGNLTTWFQQAQRSGK